MNKNKPQQIFFSGRVAVLLLLNHLWQWLGKNTRINISWQPGINLPYKVPNPPFKNQKQSLKNAALGNLVCVWHSEQDVQDSGKLSTVQRRDQLYICDQVLQQSNCVVSTTVSEHRRDLLESGVRLNAYRGLLESKTDIMVVLLVFIGIGIVFMVLYIFEYLFQIPLL